jgi:ABC-type phosphate transport system permease subunit
MKIAQNKKGQMGGWAAGLIGGGIAVVIVVMVVAFGQQFLTTAGTNFAPGSAAANSTQAGITGLSTFTSNIGLIALAVVLVAVIGLLIGLWLQRR